MKFILFIGVVVSAIIGVVFLLRGSEIEEIGKWKVLTESELMHGSRISKVMFFDKENGIAVSPGVIAKTDDGGKRWAHVHSVKGNGYYSFAFSDGRNGVAVGSVNNEVPLVLRTNDAGRSWQTLNFDPKLLNRGDIKITTFLDVCFDSTGQIWIVGNRGIVSAAVEVDKLNITSVYSTTDELFSVACAENGQIWAVGGNTVLSNRGDGWQKNQLDAQYSFGKLKSIGKETWLLGGIQSEAELGLDSGIVLRSKDSGQTWENRTPKFGGLQYDIFRQDGMLWLAGEGGQIHYSKDNGDTWLKSPNPSNSNLLSIYFLDSRSGWISGERGTILAYMQ